MKKLTLFIKFVITSHIILAQVGINTKDPKAMLDINGSLQIRKEIRVGETYDPGSKSMILISQGPNIAPKWISSDHTNKYSISQSILATDEIGVSYHPNQTVDNILHLEEFSDMTDWDEIEGLRSEIYISSPYNQIVAEIQTMLQFTTSNLYPAAIVSIGIFIDNQLRSTRTQQIAGNGLAFCPIKINDLINNLPVKIDGKPYEFRVGVRLHYFNFPLDDGVFPSDDELYWLFVGHSDESIVTNTNNFYNRTSLNINVYENLN